MAKALHVEIKKIMDKPVKYVLLENSQSHAMLGSNYWKEQGAIVISQEIAKQEIMSKGEYILNRKRRILKDKLLGTKIVLPDVIPIPTRNRRFKRAYCSIVQGKRVQELLVALNSFNEVICCNMLALWVKDKLSSDFVRLS